jgi:CMP-N-acetylneuraminic acid synthetase
MLKEIVGLIPVKGSSDRVPMKNLRKFGNSSLYELKLSQLLRAEGFKEIIVSSEEESILSIAEKKGFGTHKRNPKYSTSDIPMSEVYSYIASEIKGENIAWINVTNPLAEGHIYTNAIKIFNELDKKFDCLLSANNLQENVFYKGIPVNFKPSPWPRSQDLQGCCTLPFVINILKRQNMVNWGSCVGKSPYFYFLDKIESWDIDTQEDFDFCEMIYNQRNSQSLKSV